jgi:hypothetical protein
MVKRTAKLWIWGVDRFDSKATAFCILGICPLLLAGCALFRDSAGRTDAPASARRSSDSKINDHASPTNNHGFALLFDLVKDEKDISKLRFIKRERPELKTLLQDIARSNREAYAKLEKFGKADPQLNLKDQGLPSEEVETRAAIGKFKENTILHTTDKDLEVHLLLSENEALTYGLHLAKTLARTEDIPERQQFLRQLTATFGQLLHRVIEMLVKNYSWSEATPMR